MAVTVDGTVYGAGGSAFTGIVEISRATTSSCEGSNRLFIKEFTVSGGSFSTALDAHCEIDSPGSRQENIK